MDWAQEVQKTDKLASAGHDIMLRPAHLLPHPRRSILFLETSDGLVGLCAVDGRGVSMPCCHHHELGAIPQPLISRACISAQLLSLENELEGRLRSTEAKRMESLIEERPECGITGVNRQRDTLALK